MEVRVFLISCHFKNFLKMGLSGFSRVYSSSSGGDREGLSRIEGHQGSIK